MNATSRSVQLGVLFAALFVAMVGFGVVLPALGHLSLRFEASAFSMGIMTSAYAFAQFLAAPAWGRLSDRIGRKPVVVVGILGFGLSFLVMGFAVSFSTLMVGRVLGGLLSAATIPAAQAYAADLSTPAERARVLGLMGAAMALGFVLGPALSVVLVPLGPSAPFFVSAALGLGTGAVGLVLLTEPRRTVPAPSAAPGRSSLRAALVGPEAAWYWTTFAVMFGASSTFATLVYLIEGHLRGSQRDASFAFAAFGGASAVAQGLLVGPVVRRFGEAPTVATALAVGAIGFAALALADHLVQVHVGIALVALGMALSRPTMTSLVTRRSPLGQGAALGVQSSFDALGRMLGPLWAGWLYGLRPGAPYLSSACAYLLGFVAVVMHHRASATAQDGAPPTDAPGV